LFLLDITCELRQAPLYLVAENDRPRIDTQAIFTKDLLIVTILLENLPHSSDSIDGPVSHQKCLRKRACPAQMLRGPMWPIQASTLRRKGARFAPITQGDGGKANKSSHV
jgi:hypothetical protein